MATFTVEPAKNPDGLPLSVTTTGNEATPELVEAMAPTDVTVPVAVVVGVWPRAPCASWAWVLSAAPCAVVGVWAAPKTRAARPPPFPVAGVLDGVTVAA